MVHAQILSLVVGEVGSNPPRFVFHNISTPRRLSCGFSINSQNKEIPTLVATPENQMDRIKIRICCIKIVIQHINLGLNLSV
jgi:hypothetical protein